MTLENKELLINSYKRDFDLHQEKINQMKIKILNKEEYCFGDIEKIIELYIDLYREKTLHDSETLSQKLKNFINHQSIEQKYVLSKEHRLFGSNHHYDSR